MILTNVDNFSNYPDGRIRLEGMAPMPSEIAMLMRDLDLHLGDLGEAGHCARSLLGTSVSASGEGVMGYLLDGEGLEAPSSDLEVFLDAVTTGFSVVKISGHYCPDQGVMIQSCLSAWRDHNEVITTSKRELIESNGARRIIQATAPIVATGMQLSLAG